MQNRKSTWLYEKQGMGEQLKYFSPLNSQPSIYPVDADMIRLQICWQGQKNFH